MWLLFVPVVVLVVIVASLASLFAGVLWMLGATWPWLLIALGVWLFFHERKDATARRRPSRHASDRQTPAQSGSPQGNLLLQRSSGTRDRLGGPYQRTRADPH